MNKPVTAERIRKAIAHIQAARGRDEQMKRDGDIIQSLATYGLRSSISRACGVQEDPLTGQRMDMDMTYLEAPRSIESMEILMDRWQQSIERYYDKIQRIYEIQRHHQISGLAPSTTEFGSTVIEHPWDDDDLVLIESDLDELNKWKPVIVEKWLDYLILNNLDIYEHKDGQWHLSDRDRIYAAMPFFRWANAWEHVHYHSPSRMNSQGWDELRLQPKYDDDSKDWEVHLLLGEGLYIDDPDTSIWFCASNGVPSN